MAFCRPVTFDFCEIDLELLISNHLNLFQDLEDQSFYQTSYAPWI